jgi:ankyrin repeat protein
MCDAELKRLVRTIVAADDAVVFALLATKPTLVRAHFEDGATRQIARPYYIDEIGHYVYSGAQAATVACLIEAGADPNALDKNGATPLHRAVRTRCAAAVKVLLENGAHPRRKNKNGSTPMLLATQNTGRGGSGSREAKAQQEQIVGLLQEHITKRT